MQRSLLTEVVGWYGALAILAAYFLNSFHLINTGTLYQALNLTGAVGIVVVSLAKKTYQPAFLNIIWAVVALVALLRVLF